MKTRMTAASVLALAAQIFGVAALADGQCATPDQARQVQAFYKDNPATMPVIAARKLSLPETVIASGLAASESAGTSAAAFTDVWAAMTQWKSAIFMVTKGENIFEIVSPIAPATPSKTSKYTNIAYDHPLRGHLRPDLYASIYAVALPNKEGQLARGIVFYDASGASVFSAFISGEGPPPSAEEIAKFDKLMALIRSRPAACPP